MRTVEVIKINAKTKKISLIAGIMGVILWVVLTAYYYLWDFSLKEKVENLLYVFFLLLIPSCVAIIASKKDSNPLLLLAIIWAMPFSLFSLLSIWIAIVS